MKAMEEKEVEHGLSVCTVQTGEDVFGIATSAVREALHRCELRKVPLAPSFVAGVLAYRGDILLAVSLRALLGMEAMAEASSAVVLEDSESGEAFALLLDELLDVVQVDARAWEPNPVTLDVRRSAVYGGVYRRADGPLVRLESRDVQPTWLIRHQGAIAMAGAGAR
jgi:purine-binding chemotaxis protein CheW